tara:strand:- start:166 stop:534 length:369 start_codon:yes stop_codon:yes gene_type:complete
MLGGINNNLQTVFNNTTFIFIINTLLIYYIVFISFKLNNELIVLFDNSLIKMLILVVIFYTSTYNTEIAVLIMIGFICSLNTLNNIKLKDLLNLNEDIDYLNTETETEIETEADLEEIEKDN